MGPADILYNLVKNQITGETDLAAIEQQIGAVAASAGIPDQIADEVIHRFRTELKVRSGGKDPTPRLLVDWGDLPRVGHQARPEFSLLCPEYRSRPDVMIRVDGELDHNPDDPLRSPQISEPGIWTFHVPFRMTSDGLDCRPGQYMIDVAVTFRDVPAEMPRFYRCRIRLMVPSSAAEGGVLEIDGDGQSMVNLQGYDLKQFSKVVLKGGQDSVINLQNALSLPKDSDHKSEPPATTYEYQLKIDTEKQSRLPAVKSTTQTRSYLDAASLIFEDGRRVLLFARPRLSLGRNRDNDVILRFVPSGEDNDRLSRNISRVHFWIELTNDGIEIRDESRSGIEVNYKIVNKREVISAAHSGDIIHLDLGVTGTVEKQFSLEMTIFSPDRRESQEDLEYWDEVYCEVVGGRVSRLGREAVTQRINAIRLDRTDNLKGEETYVMLTREALIGGSPSQCSVVLKQGRSQAEARLLHMDRTFWLEALPGASGIQVDGVSVGPRTLVSLSPGVAIRFGGEMARFDRPMQRHLD